jgi:hypothetical protein
MKLIQDLIKRTKLLKNTVNIPEFIELQALNFGNSAEAGD